MTTTASKVKNGILILLILVISNSGFAQVSIQKDGRHSSVTIEKNGLNSFKVDYRGKISISDDDRDITAISSGGHIEISKTAFGSKREVRIEGTSSGLTREYYVGRQKVEWEPEGRKWLAEILPEVVRSSGIGAESRVNRFYKQGGVSAVIEELQMINSDYVEAIYAGFLLDMDLSSSELVQALEGVSDEIDSDYYLANVLKDRSRKLLAKDEVATAYFKAVREIGSDYYAAAVLKEALEDGDFSGEQVDAIIDAAREIGSDYYMASVFMDVMSNSKISDEVIIAILESTDDIESDHYQSQVLKEVMHRDSASPEVQKALLRVVGNVSSDHYMTEVFREMLEKELDSDALADLLRVVGDEMSSDHYAHIVLKEVVDSQGLTEMVIEQLSNALDEMSSDHYASQVLQEVAREDLTDDQMIKLMQAAADIDSDHYLTEVLLSFAGKVRNGSPKLKEAYREAAKSIDSDTYYGRAVKAID